MYHGLSIHQVRNIWIVSSFLAVTDRTTINVHVQVLCEHRFSFYLGKYLAVGLWGHTASVYLVL